MRFLKRTKQCSKCPWRKDVNPLDIPNGYSVEKYKALKDTIAPKNPTPEECMDILHPQSINRIMSCHETDIHDECPCVGWVFNQIKNDNIVLRMILFNDPDYQNLEVYGEQHETFEDTIPLA